MVSFGYKMMSFQLMSEKAVKPTKRNNDDVGYELYSAENKLIKSKERASFDTGICFSFPISYCGIVKCLPELALDKYIDVCESIVQSSSATTKIILINNSENNFRIREGDKIAYLIIQKFFDQIFMFEII